ncbi:MULTISPECIES: ribonuclease III [Prosthecochloris]|uniref:Ribonuclease 3 n=1 Tax=Prosthecochloris vibrioformis TaxID=1098 RepID=A0A5C4S0B9_PROVB|nr:MULTISPECIES: ribonuclease III [Prosthecochloris]ANT63944.1 Ribonuclease 3 [Prosthecochloris sp. CIB 2401]TNJ36477.1 ribonuclease III [Prosthecochloris vibrioformis]
MEHFWQKIGRLTPFRPKREELLLPQHDIDDNRPDHDVPGVVDYAALETLLNHTCDDSQLYAMALTHRSCLQDADEPLISNQRLEFLGDAVLDLIVSEELYTQFPDYDEGLLSSNRAKIVNGKSLAAFARKLDLGNLVIVGPSADKARIRQSDATLADAFEALVGAIYLDKGLDAARAFIRDKVLDETNLTKLTSSEHNYKSRLIEYTQARQLEHPRYIVVEESGAEHEKIFLVEVRIGEETWGRGSGSRKKEAEQHAAMEAITAHTELDI